MGFHLGTLAAHFIDAKKYDFVEMLLHHTLTFYLYGGCYFFNAWECGVVIAMVHDSTEILLTCTKMWAETIYRKITTYVFFTHLALWIYIRQWVFPQLIWGCWKIEVELHSNLVQPFFCYLLTCLFLMHCYWLVLMLNIVHYNIYGKLYKRELYRGDTEEDIYDEC